MVRWTSCAPYSPHTLRLALHWLLIHFIYGIPTMAVVYALRISNALYTV